MEGLGLDAGYMLVPWSSWDQWNFVREFLFSSSSNSVAAALRRIAAWRSRGCLPIAIQVSAAIVEIQQKDPFFRKEPTCDTLNSEEMLAMLYSMALMRLVNGFVEKVNGFDDHTHKRTPRKKNHSISEIADAIGMPRMVVDIRHESSHRDLPSLPLVRLASMKALDWLKSHYWEPQRSVIPDVRKEIRSRLHHLCYYMKAKQAERLSSSQIMTRCIKQSRVLRTSNKLSSQITGKLVSSKSNGSQKLISKISKIIARLYSRYPLEVASVLLEIFQLQAFDLPKDIAVDRVDNPIPGDPEPRGGSIHELKVIITKLSSRSPGLLLTMLKEVLSVIEAKEAMKYEKGEYCHQVEHLSSLVPWLLMNLKELRKSEKIGLADDTQVLSASTKTIPKVSLKELLRKCLLLSASGNKHLSDSALFIAEMIGNNSLSERLKKLPLLSSQNLDFTADDTTSSCPEPILFQEEESIKQAAEKLDLLKSRLSKGGIRTAVPGDGDTGRKKNMWTVAKCWTPCPIGMLPCTFSSTAFLPVLEKVDDGCTNNEPAIKEHEVTRKPTVGKRDAGCSIELSDNSTARKKLKETAGNIESSDGNGPVAFPMEGQLLIGGVWRRVGEEELLAIESSIRILVQ